MTQIAWLSDLHLNSYFSKKLASRNAFLDPIVESAAEAVVITGDISISSNICASLKRIEDHVKRPIYFVLGNHDFWGSDFSTTRKIVNEFVKNSEYCKYLHDVSYVKLSPDTFLIGQDCWYDANYGTPETSRFIMNDWHFINDFVFGPNCRNNTFVIQKCRELANHDVRILHQKITSILSLKEKPKNIIVISHFPPFAETSMHEGKRSDNDALPWYVNRSLGVLLRDAAEKFSDINFTVLCGHTHNEFEAQILPNLNVKVAGAEYGHPKISKFLTF